MVNKMEGVCDCQLILFCYFSEDVDINCTPIHTITNIIILF